jgi:hypothetical protein
MTPDSDKRICEFCGESRYFDLLEVWPDERSWMMDTCCAEYHETLLDDFEYALELPAGRKRSRFLKPLLDLFAGYGLEVGGVYEDAGWLRLSYPLEIRPVDLATAKAFVATHHRHNKAPLSWRFGLGCWNGDELIGVAMVGRPAARMIATRQPGTVEVTRLCVNHDLPPGMTHFASSRLYDAATAEAARRGFTKAITYTLESESGGSLRAAGWIAEHVTRAESWNRKSRPRADVAPAGRKVRWAKPLNAEKHGYETHQACVA